MIELLSPVASLLRHLIKPFTDFFQSERRSNLDHDIAVFRKLDAMGTESRIDDILNDRIYNSSFRREDDHTLSDLIGGLSRIENRFLDSTLQKSAEEMRDQMADLLGFVRQTFFSISGGWLKFYPDPIDEDRFNQEWAELCSKIDKSWEAYKNYRMTVKKRLKI